MDLLLTRSLLAVAEHGTIGEAASRLGVSQSALSRRIQQLEEELGAELLERSGRGVTLTEAGRLAVAEGTVLVERYGRLQTMVREHLELDAGTVRIGGGATAVSYLLPGAMARFRKKHPGIRFRLEEAGSRHVETALLEERIDLGIVTLPVQTKEVDVMPLSRDRFVLVASADHALASRRRVRAEELDGLPLIAFEAGSAIRTLIDDALRSASVAMNVVMEVRSIAAILRLLDATGGLAFVSELGVGGRQVLDVQGLRVERELGLITRRGRGLSPAAQAFVEEVRKVAGG
ncbi:MAG TPA: LysR substrate-binding domain-containing protein [Polyangiaceae bacterium]|nr:LysR substrate-binding domain-containing protein [Polyangiaceae bacterium]